MDAWSLISIKIIRFYLVLYIAQTVPTHPESFQTDRFRNRRYVKWIGNALPYENLNPDILFHSYSPVAQKAKLCFKLLLLQRLDENLKQKHF